MPGILKLMLRIYLSKIKKKKKYANTHQYKRIDRKLLKFLHLKLRGGERKNEQKENMKRILWTFF